MIRSMTGFGRAENQDADYRITVDMKSVNNRYLDFNIRMPKKYAAFESQIRATLKEYIQRGKVDVFISTEDHTGKDTSLIYSRELAASYYGYMKQISEDLGIPADIRVTDIARSPEVLKMEEESGNEEELWEALEPVIREAAEQFRISRENEGGRLKDDLLGKLEGMKACAEKIEALEPKILEDYRARLTAKMQEILEDRNIDDSRIAAEVILYADRICTDEETVRLKSHIEEMKSVLTNEDGAGRKLDFLAQEMNREANTILSKANDLTTSDIGIELKTEIEKVREQVQNIE
jgi:uncharacterized protein (TIGR00255 family)